MPAGTCGASDDASAVADHVIPGRRAVTEALAAGRPLTRILVQDRDRDEALVSVAGQAGAEVRTAGRAELDALAAGVVHQGVVALTSGFGYRALTDLGGDVVVALDGVTDPQNLGAIARSAEAAGAGGLVLPRRRSVHVTPAAEKAAAGAFSWLDVALVPNLARALTDLSARGLWAVGLHGDAPAPLWEEPLLDGPVVLVVGAEGRGLSRLVAERCDTLVSIPTAGRLAALNASVAAAVALFEVARRRAGR